MKEDVIKFRKVYNILIDKKVLTAKSIIKELGLSEPSLHKILTADLDELKGLRASTLGMLQDFMKRHINDLNYAGIESDPLAESTNDVRIKIKPGVKERREQELRERGKDPGPIKTFWDFIALASGCIPENVTINITINERKS